METIELSSDDSDHESGLAKICSPTVVPTVSACNPFAYFSCISTDTCNTASCSYTCTRTGNNTERNNDKKETENGTSISSSGSTTAFEIDVNQSKRGRTSNDDGGKTTTAAERQALNKKLIEERRAAKNANKIYKPGECMKYMTVEIHPVLLESWFCGDVQREVNAAGAKVNTCTHMLDSGIVLLSRSMPHTLTNNAGTVELTQIKQQCSRGLYVKTAEDLEYYVEADNLARYVTRAADLVGCVLTLLVFGVKDYFKSGRKRVMSELDLEKAMTDVLVRAKSDTLIVNTPNELALTIAQFTKAIAEEPYKRAKWALDEKAEFYMRGDNKNCVAVDKDGNGLSRLWQQMIAVLPQSSLETSRALCAEHKTPLALHEALQSPDGVGELADLRVSRSAVPLSKMRRVGPEFARKLHTLFTAEDGNTILE